MSLQAIVARLARKHDPKMQATLTVGFDPPLPTRTPCRAHDDDRRRRRRRLGQPPIPDGYAVTGRVSGAIPGAYGSADRLCLSGLPIYIFVLSASNFCKSHLAVESTFVTLLSWYPES